MASLQKLARRSEPIYLPGHGAPVRDAPRYVQYLIRHRQGREASILHRLGKGAADIADHRQGGLYRARSAPDRRRRAVGAGASGRSGGARRGGDRRPAVDRRHLSLGRCALPAEASAAARRFLLRLPAAASTARHRYRRSGCARARHWCRDHGGRSARPNARRCARHRSWRGCAPRRHRGKPRIGVRATASIMPSRRSARRASITAAGPAAGAHRPRAICAWR